MSWGHILVGRTLTQHSQSSVFHHQQHMNWYAPKIPKMSQEDQIFKITTDNPGSSSPDLATWDYLKDR